MPLLFVKSLDKDVRLGVWKIEEDVDDFLTSQVEMHTIFQQEIAAYKSQARRLEKLAVYSLLWNMVNDCPIITHNADGKPFVQGWNISISHTKGYAAVMVSPHSEVAVDIEYRSNRVSRIAHRFMRDDEMQAEVTAQLVSWCAKETLYKYYSAQNLQYFDMRVTLDNSAMTHCFIENLKANTRHQVEVNVTDDYVLTYVVGNEK